MNTLEQMRGIRFGKEYLEYYVIYDLNDNIVAYLDDINDLSKCTGLRKKDINYKFKKSLLSYIYVVFDNSKYKVFRFN